MKTPVLFALNFIDIAFKNKEIPTQLSSGGIKLLTVGVIQLRNTSPEVNGTPASVGKAPKQWIRGSW